MRVVGQFNKISEATKKKIKPLKKGEQVNYRLLTGMVDIATGEVRYGASRSIVCRDVIQDVETGELVQIGVPKVIKDGEVLRVKKFVISATGDNIINNGIFTLFGGNLEHQEFYEFFEICNYNNSNPDRDPSVQPLFERIDEEAEAEAENAELDILTKALVLASQMTRQEQLNFASGKNWNTKEHPSILKNRIKRFAQEYPAEFLAAADDPDTKDKVLIKQCLDAAIIGYQPAEHKILWKDGKTLARLERAENGESEVELLLQWLRESKNGDNILKNLQGQLKAYKAQANGEGE